MFFETDVSRLEPDLKVAKNFYERIYKIYAERDLREIESEFYE